ncbi:MAG: hypothetical protein IJ058_13880 [Lachnospiraceae bacterium]|nr:hypothetical protein [Lachnospiraceae bacterium]MBQ8947869.1 hypothetical protein [Lachnospiraceae bacterium]
MGIKLNDSEKLDFLVDRLIDIEREVTLIRYHLEAQERGRRLENEIRSSEINREIQAIADKYRTERHYDRV